MSGGSLEFVIWESEKIDIRHRNNGIILFFWEVKKFFVSSDYRLEVSLMSFDCFSAADVFGEFSCF